MAWKLKALKSGKAPTIALVVAIMVVSGISGWVYELGKTDQAYDIGWSDGQKAGWEDGSAYSSNTSWSEGYDAGYDLGYAEGADGVVCPDNYETGYDAGYAAGQDDCPLCPDNGNGNGDADNWPGKKTEKPGKGYGKGGKKG